MSFVGRKRLQVFSTHYSLYQRLISLAAKFCTIALTIWFQRHEEPKVATDEYEQGTYVYFDFHIANDDLQHGW